MLAAIEGPKKIGPYELHTVETGSFALDGGAMFGIVPKAIWNKTNPADDLNRIDMRLRCLLLIKRDNASGKAERVILIDNGMGEKWAAKHVGMYKIDHSTTSIDRSPRQPRSLGRGRDRRHCDAPALRSRAVAARGRVNGELVPAFPNARFWVQRQNWDLAYHPNEKDRASYLAENFDVYRGNPKLCLLDTKYGAREEILPGVFARVSNGHTPGLQMIEVADSSAAVLYCADAIPTATHVRVPFIMGYDCFPLTMIDEKKTLLAEAAERGMILFFEHCPHAEAASVVHDGKDYAVKQAFRFSRDPWGQRRDRSISHRRPPKLHLSRLRRRRVDRHRSASRTSRRGRRACKELGSKLVGVALTHTHWDHVAGVPGVVAQYKDIPIYVHEADARRLRDLASRRARAVQAHHRRRLDSGRRARDRRASHARAQRRRVLLSHSAWPETARRALHRRHRVRGRSRPHRSRVGKHDRALSYDRAAEEAGARDGRLSGARPWPHPDQHHRRRDRAFRRVSLPNDRGARCPSLNRRRLNRATTPSSRSPRARLVFRA